MYAVPGPDPVSASIFAFLAGWQLGVTATNLTIGAINAFDRAAFERDITAFNAMSGERQNKNRRERQAGGGEQSCPPATETGGGGQMPPGAPPRAVAEDDDDPEWITPREKAERDHDALRDTMRAQQRGFESGRHDQYPRAMENALRNLARQSEARGDLPQYAARLREIAETYAKRAGAAHRGGR
jgi:hypothetical protein